MSLDLTAPLLPMPVDEWDDAYAAYRQATQRPACTTCLGPYEMGETCLHRLAQDRLSLVDVCEGCTRLWMHALDRVLPDLDWRATWRRRAGMPEGGGPR